MLDYSESDLADFGHETHFEYTEFEAGELITVVPSAQTQGRWFESPGFV